MATVSHLVIWFKGTVGRICPQVFLEYNYTAQSHISWNLVSFFFTITAFITQTYNLKC